MLLIFLKITSLYFELFNYITNNYLIYLTNTDKYCKLFIHL